jgi:hypothetical protein
VQHPGAARVVRQLRVVRERDLRFHPQRS